MGKTGGLFRMKDTHPRLRIIDLAELVHWSCQPNFIFQIRVHSHVSHTWKLKKNIILEHIGTWTGLGKEGLDDNFHQLLLGDSESH